MRDTYVDYYGNISRLMKYIQATIGLPLILSIEKYGNIKWYVDAAFVVQNYMRGHTVGFMAMVPEGGGYV